MTLTIGSLFSGIGGLELGLEWAGLGPVVFQCEIDPFCRAVLAKHWPNVTRFEDVTQPRNWPTVDLLCGGFPCQDVSSAGKRRGIGGQRSGLWYHFANVVRRIQPRFVVVENVASGSSKWLRPVRHQLHVLGYRTRALGVAASDVGAPHRRARVFVVAHPAGVTPRGAADTQGCQAPTDAHGEGQLAIAEHAEVAGASSSSADTDRNEVHVAAGRRSGSRGTKAAERGHVGWRQPEPDVVRVVHGLSRGLDSARRKSLGNAVVPQCAQVVGEVIRQMIASEAATREEYEAWVNGGGALADLQKAWAEFRKELLP